MMRILCVDDDAVSMQTLVRVLHEWGSVRYE
jgi:CheY-like chemotaxis protein